jgi:hypothetical protein
VAAAPSNHYALNRSLANPARLAFPSVDPVLQLKESFLAVGIDIIRNGRAAQLDGLFKHFLDGGVEA